MHNSKQLHLIERTDNCIVEKEKRSDWGGDFVFGREIECVENINIQVEKKHALFLKS